MTNDTGVPTKELERQWRIATRPAPDDVTEEMARAGCEAHDYLSEVAEELAAEVLDGRKRDIATRKALVEARKLNGRYGSQAAVDATLSAALAAMGVPDGE